MTKGQIADKRISEIFDELREIAEGLPKDTQKKIEALASEMLDIWVSDVVILAD